MIILDTNVLSALLPPQPNAVVVKWANRQPPDSLWITSISLFDVQFGIELLPISTRRAQLTEAFKAVVERAIAGRVLDFDRLAAMRSAPIAAERRRRGMTVDVRDTQIAGIALSRFAQLATRNTRHFDDMELALINPWLEG